MDFKRAEWENMGLIHLAQDRDQWCALVNVVLNLCVQRIS
jgi:hypothetical protein